MDRDWVVRQGKVMWCSPWKEKEGGVVVVVLGDVVVVLV